MNRGSTLILRAALLLSGLAVLAICVFGLPRLIMSEITGDFDYGPIFVGLYLPAILYFVALYQAWRLLDYIDENQAFSSLSVKRLEAIKYCALGVSALFIAGMPYIFYIADRDDAPGLAAMGLVIAGASFVMATAASVFQRLFQSVIDTKSGKVRLAPVGK